MGYWGTGLYQNDITCDVRDSFEEKWRELKDKDEITRLLLSEFEDAEQFPDDAVLMWLALADSQWRKGMLVPEVRDKTLSLLERLLNKKDSDNLELCVRENELVKLRERLLSPQPKEKKPGHRRLYICPWNTGDVFAYKLEGDLAEKKGMLGRYLLIRKIDEYLWDPGHVVPIVHIKISNDCKLPSSIKEYEEAVYIQVGYTRFEERFLPIDMSRPKEDIAEKSKTNYEVDEYGVLPQYRIRLIQTSKKETPGKLIYIGNYQSVKLPQKEFIPHSKINYQKTFWNNKGLLFEDDMIMYYCSNNLRENYCRKV